MSQDRREARLGRLHLPPLASPTTQCRGRRFRHHAGGMSNRQARPDTKMSSPPLPPDAEEEGKRRQPQECGDCRESSGHSHDSPSVEWVVSDPAPSRRDPASYEHSYEYRERVLYSPYKGKRTRTHYGVLCLPCGSMEVRTTGERVEPLSALKLAFKAAFRGTSCCGGLRR